MIVDVTKFSDDGMMYVHRVEHLRGLAEDAQSSWCEYKFELYSRDLNSTDKEVLLVPLGTKLEDVTSASIREIRKNDTDFLAIDRNLSLKNKKLVSLYVVVSKELLALIES